MNKVLCLNLDHSIQELLLPHFSDWNLFAHKSLRTKLQGVPHLRGFHYHGSHYSILCLMYSQLGDFCVSRGPPTVPLMQILLNTVF